MYIVWYHSVNIFLQLSFLLNICDLRSNHSKYKTLKGKPRGLSLWEFNRGGKKNSENPDIGYSTYITSRAEWGLMGAHRRS